MRAHGKRAKIIITLGVLLSISQIVSYTCVAAPSKNLVIGVSGAAERVATENLVNLALSNPALRLLNVDVVEMEVEEAYRSMLANKGPDILLISGSWARMLSDFGLLVDFTQIAAKDTNLKSGMNHIYPSAMQSARWRGKLMGIPHSMELTGVVYNPKHLRDVGVRVANNWSWDDFAIIGRKLQSRNIPLDSKQIVTATDHELGVSQTIEKVIGVALSINARCWLPFLWSNGGEYIPESFRSININSIQARETFSWMKSLLSTDAATLWLGNISVGLAMERISMAPTSSYVFDYARLRVPPSDDKHFDMIKHLYPSNDLELIMAPYPIAPRTGKSVGEISTRIYTISKSSSRIEDAIRLIGELISVKVQSYQAKSGQVPVRSDVQLPNSNLLITQDVIVRIAYSTQTSGRLSIRDISLTQPATKHLYDYLSDRITLETFISKTSNEVNNILRSWDGNPRTIWPDFGTTEQQISFTKSP